MLLKVIPLYKDEKKVIKKATQNNREAQHYLYKKYSAVMLSVCRQYINDIQYAEDVMISGFLKVFMQLGTYKGEGSFEGWIKRIMIRESISFLRKHKKLIFSEETYLGEQEGNSITVENTFEVDAIQKQIDNLPEGYKTVFVMYAIEGYSHKEISELLNISVGTSKSQLYKAKKMLQEKLLKLNQERNGTK